MRIGSPQSQHAGIEVNPEFVADIGASLASAARPRPYPFQVFPVTHMAKAIWPPGRFQFAESVDNPMGYIVGMRPFPLIFPLALHLHNLLVLADSESGIERHTESPRFIKPIGVDGVKVGVSILYT